MGLPGYAWDPALHNYVDLATGRMVKRKAVVQLLTGVVERADDVLAALARAAVRGEITPRQFYELAQREVKHAYNASVALAEGGWHQVPPAEWGRNGGYLRKEYARLREFAAAMERGELTEAQAVARARLYGNSAYGRYWDIRTAQARRRGKTRERLRTAGDDRVCPVCLDEEASGWRPIGTYRVPIHAGCRCFLDYG